MHLDDGRRIAGLKGLVSTVMKMITRLETGGIKIRFMNSTEDGDFNNLRSMEEVDQIMSRMKFDGRFTRIGKALRSKILEPMVFEKTETKSLTRPILVTIITDGRVGIPTMIYQYQLRFRTAKWGKIHPL